MNVPMKSSRILAVCVNESKEADLALEVAMDLQNPESDDLILIHGLSPICKSVSMVLA